MINDIGRDPVSAQGPVLRFWVAGNLKMNPHKSLWSSLPSLAHVAAEQSGLLNEHLSSNCCVLGPILDTRNKTDKLPGQTDQGVNHRL